MSKSRINQSLSWWCYAREGVDPKKLIKEAARIGYASIEMLPQEHWDLVRENGMKIAITVGHGTLADVVRAMCERWCTPRSVSREP